MHDSHGHSPDLAPQEKKNSVPELNMVFISNEFGEMPKLDSKTGVAEIIAVRAIPVLAYVRTDV